MGGYFYTKSYISQNLIANDNGGGKGKIPVGNNEKYISQVEM